MTRYALTIVDAGRPGDPPVAIRLRKALKVLLRAFSLKCVSIGPVLPTMPTNLLPTPAKMPVICPKNTVNRKGLIPFAPSTARQTEAKA